MNKRSLLRWTLSILGLLAIALLVWFVGPLVAIAGHEPLAGDLTRLLVILCIAILWLLNIVRKLVQANRANAQLSAGISEAAAPADAGPGEAERSAEEVAALKARFDQALEILKKSRGKGAANLHDLPWYVIIGPPGSGKTTALVNSGLDFPLAERFGKGAIQGIGGTRNCDWWFTNEAVLLDTAGRYLTQDSDQAIDRAAWEGFLGLLKRHRRRRPLNGVMVAMSLSDLMLYSDSERERHARVIRERIQEIYAFFGIRFPIYVLFTKCDLVAGCMDFYDDLGREERAQVWGVTFPLAESAPGERFDEEYQALLGRLNDRLLWRISQERDPDRRARIYAFPQQMATLRGVACGFIADVFRGTRYDQQPLLRGVYFTSGTQEGTPIDRIMGAVARSFGLATQSLAFAGGAGRSYFITDLLRKVVFAEAGVVGANRRFERQRAWIQRTAYALTLLISVGAVLAWSTGYTGNLGYVARMDERVATYNKEAEKTKQATAGDTGYAALLPALDALRATREVYAEFAQGVPTRLELGLYQGRKLGAAADDAYLRELRRTLLPRIAAGIANRLARGSDDPDFSYTALKTYLMLGDPQHFDPALLKLWLGVEWQRLYATNPRTQDDLNSHLQALIDGGLRPVALDRGLIKQVRNRLTQVPLAELVYGRLKRDAEAAQKHPWRLADVLGVAGRKVFVGASGRAFDQVIPELFTYRGYFQIYLKESAALAGRIRKESWVLESARDKLGERELAQLDSDLGKLYAADYVRAWKKLLADLHMARLASITTGVEQLEALSGRNSPLRSLLKAVAHNTSLTVLPKGMAKLAAGSAGVLGATKQRLLRLLGAGAKAATSGAPTPGQLVDQSFADLNQLVKSDKGASPPIERVIGLLSKLYSYFDAVASGDKAQSTIVRRLKKEANSLPRPVNRWLRELAAGSTTVTERKQVSDAAKVRKDKKLQLLASMNAAWEANVLPLCRRGLIGRYPFAHGAEREMALRDFGSLFAPGGLINKFFATHLKPFVDTSSSRWRWLKSEGVDLQLDPSLLVAFEAAARIRDAFFQDGGSVPAVHFALKPVFLDRDATQFHLAIQGQKFVYRHGPSRAQKARWPNAGGVGEVRMFFQGVDGKRDAITKDSAWGWFRLLDEADVEPEGAERMLVTFRAGNHQAKYEIIASSVINPFLMRDLGQFRCPERF